MKSSALPELKHIRPDHYGQLIGSVGRSRKLAPPMIAYPAECTNVARDGRKLRIASSLHLLLYA